MTYDKLNRMLRHEGPSGVEVFAYRGAEWHRFSQATAAGGKQFLYDGDNVVADIASGVDAFYVTPFLDQNLSITTGGSTYYYSQDGLGSVRTLTDSTGAVKNSYDYLPFGGAYQPGTSVTVEQRYTYTGRERDAASDIMYYRYRPYDPRIGWMLNRNPWGYVHRNFSLYDAMNQSPVYYVEPFSDPNCPQETNLNVALYKDLRGPTHSPPTDYGLDHRGGTRTGMLRATMLRMIRRIHREWTGRGCDDRACIVLKPSGHGCGGEVYINFPPPMSINLRNQGFIFADLADENVIRIEITACTEAHDTPDARIPGLRQDRRDLVDAITASSRVDTSSTMGKSSPSMAGRGGPDPYVSQYVPPAPATGPAPSGPGTAPAEDVPPIDFPFIDELPCLPTATASGSIPLSGPVYNPPRR
jgi:RHS repeat-associated protein